MANANLTNAKKAKNDEFYTQLTDIEKEMRHYKDFFKGKVVYCNCDDARESNFFKSSPPMFSEENEGIKLQFTPEYIKWIEDKTLDIECPNGESKSNYKKRIRKEFIEFISDLNKRKISSVLLVSHGGTIGTILEEF